MMVTTKVTHGMIITILNYNYYQNPKNYEGHNEGQSEGHIEGTILTRKDRKKEETPDFFSLKNRYPNSDLIDKVFQAIASTRKSGKVADSVLFAQLKKWGRYPVEQVENGIKIYLEKDYAGQGKREEYLLAIIRNNYGEKDQHQQQASNTPKQQPTIEELMSND